MIDFLVDVLRQEGMRRAGIGNSWLLGALFIYSPFLSHVTPAAKLIYDKLFNGGCDGTAVSIYKPWHFVNLSMI